MDNYWLVVFEGSSEHEEPHGISSAVAADSFDGCGVVMDDAYHRVFAGDAARATLAKVQKGQQYVVLRMTPRDAQRVRDAQVVEEYHIVAVHAL